MNRPMQISLGRNRRFLFLQGPHGPVFAKLGSMLQKTGAKVWRVGFNAGDEAFWPSDDSYIPFKGSPESWPETLAKILEDHSITDIALYGDTRRVHAEAIAEARLRNLTIHVFEEGYLRPYWVTYERGGSNGHSRLMQMSVAHIQSTLALSEADAPLPPAHWGDMRHHVFYGALYHWFVMFRNRRYGNFRPHRDLPVRSEFSLHLKRLLLMPAHAIERRIATRRIHRGSFPYHLALLQLEHDSSFQMHSTFSSITDFIAEVIAGFSKGAPRHHHLVFKAHPLEDDRTPLRREIRRIAREDGVFDRVHFVRGGKLARLLDEARSAVTVNSTAGQQVLWRGLPLKTFGKAVYDKPEFVSNKPLADFFSDPDFPDNAAYRDFRRFLLQTSQIPGGYYSAKGRQQFLRHVADMMLSEQDPYDALMIETEAPRQQLQLVPKGI